MTDRRYDPSLVDIWNPPLFGTLESVSSGTLESVSFGTLDVCVTELLGFLVEQQLAVSLSHLDADSASKQELRNAFLHGYCPENFFFSDLVDHSGRPPPFTAAIMAKRKSSSGADPKSKAAKPSTDVRPADQAYVTCVVSWLLGCVSLC